MNFLKKKLNMILKYEYFKFKSNDTKKDNFHWSFYQLNSEKTIVLEHIEYFDKDVKISEDFNFSYGKIKLKNGKEHIYKFGQDFYKWFDSLPTIDETSRYSPPSKHEKKVVKKFYLKNIYKI